MLLFTSLCIAIIPTLVLSSSILQHREACGKAYKVCAPVGAINSHLPSVGPDLGDLYTGLVQAVASEGTADFKPVGGMNESVERQVEETFCCAQTSQCLLLPAYDIAFCWDRFTTDFYFPDNSYGTMLWSNFTSADGTQVNLVYGNWETPDGSKGNIYSEIPSLMPNTSTMPMPTPWTSSGIGSAIPASELGSMTTMNASITPALETTISAITLISTTISVGLPPIVTTVVNSTGVPATTVTRNGTSTFSIIPATSINNALSVSCRSTLAFVVTSIIYGIMMD